MLNQEKRASQALEMLDMSHQLLHEGRIHPSSWLIKQDAGGIRHHRPRQLQQLFLTAGEIAGVLVAQVMQLDALQNNDLSPGNEGIRRAWNFASPANRTAIGPVERFIALVKNPLYTHLIGFESAELGQMVIQDDRAQQVVRLHYRKGKTFLFVFMLSRQSETPYAGCWMTDAVIPVEERV